MANEKTIKNLLEKISDELKKTEINKQFNSENFNIFEILGVSHLEVSTHSAFIANLLNPKGSHYQNSKFLKDFLKFIKVKCFNFDNANIEVEKYVGTDGRIDIFITDNEKWSIAIENKIHAKLQEKQLGRYMNFLNNNKMPNKRLVYLTLKKTPSQEESLLKDQNINPKDNEKYIHISYEEEITNWLNPFLHMGSQLSINLMISIYQYINTIKTLTNMSKNPKWYSFIDKDNYDAYKEIVNSNYRRDKIKNIFQDEIIKKCDIPGATLSKNFDTGKPEVGIEIPLKGKENSPVLNIVFESSDYRKLFIGIYDEELSKEQKQKLHKLSQGKWEEQGNWVAWKYFGKTEDDVVETLCLNKDADNNRNCLISKINELKKSWEEATK